MVRSKECFQQQIFFETNLQIETRFLNTCYPSIHFSPFISPSPLGIFKELKKGGALWGFHYLYSYISFGKQVLLWDEQACLEKGDALWGVLFCSCGGFSLNWGLSSTGSWSPTRSSEQQSDSPTKYWNKYKIQNKILIQIQKQTLLERATMWRDVFQEFSRNDHRWDTEICGIIWSHQCMAHCKAHNSQIPPLFRPLSALESCQEKTPSRQKAENTPFPKCALNSLIAQSQDLSVFCRYSELTRHRISATLPKNWL